MNVLAHAVRLSPHLVAASRGELNPIEIKTNSISPDGIIYID